VGKNRFKVSQIKLDQGRNDILLTLNRFLLTWMFCVELSFVQAVKFTSVIPMVVYL